MKIKKETFVEFLRPDLNAMFITVKRNVVKKVSSRDVSKLKLPEDTFAFIFFDIFSTIIKNGKEEIELESNRVNVSLKHYYGGTLDKIKDFKRKFPHAYVGSGYKKVIHRSNGTYEPFKAGGIFIKAE